MIYEAKVAYEIEGKVVKEQYIIEHAELFGEVESKLYEEFGRFPKFEVMSIKKNLKMREFVNEKTESDDEQKIFYATICDFFVDENNGKVKEIPYIVAVFADHMTEAQGIIANYMRQGLEDMKLKAVKETSFVDLLK